MKCPECNKEIEKAQRKYCSKECAYKAQSKEHRSCLFCGARCKRATTTFCSPKCVGAYRSKHNIRVGGPKIKYPPKLCPYCGELFKPRQRVIKYCSKHCAGMARRDDFIQNIMPLRPKVFTKEHRENISKARAKSAESSKFHSKGVIGYREDIGHIARSRWEANFARILKYLDTSYEYEPTYFVLKSPEGLNITYKPDFKIGDCYIEVKGWWTERAKLIKKLMKEQKPFIKIIYVDECLYFRLEEEFSKLIPEWEYHIDKRRKGGVK